MSLNEIVIVGAGVMGCALAWALAERGVKVVVLERAIPGAEASSAAGGILGAQAEPHSEGPLLGLALAARALWPAWAEALEEQSGVALGYRRCGLLRVAFAEDELAGLAEIRAWQQAAGLELLTLSGDEVRALEPQLSPAVLQGLYFPGDGVVDAQRLPAALAAAAERAGARLVQGGEVTGLVLEGERVAGVRTRGMTLRGDRVVLCAGAWTSQVPGVAGLPPVEPVRGQLAVVQGRPRGLGRVVFGGGGYLVPRADGRVLIGSTMERAGFDKSVTLGGLGHLCGVGLRLLPALAEAAVVQQWAGLRPATPDGLPVIGPCGPEGLYVLSGHFRNGVLLTPISARLMAQRLLGEPTELELGPFDAGRFQRS